LTAEAVVDLGAVSSSKNPNWLDGRFLMRTPKRIAMTMRTAIPTGTLPLIKLSRVFIAIVSFLAIYKLLYQPRAFQPWLLALKAWYLMYFSLSTQQNGVMLLFGLMSTNDANMPIHNANLQIYIANTTNMLIVCIFAAFVLVNL
jgi:hypothetical protein